MNAFKRNYFLTCRGGQEGVGKILFFRFFKAVSLNTIILSNYGY